MDSRFEWLKSPNEVLSKPMTECDWNLLTAHGKVLCLAENPLPAGRVWHFDPRQFIAHFRKCGWLGENDLIRLVRRNESNSFQPNLPREQLINWLNEKGQTSSGEIIRPQNVKVALPQIMNKYRIVTPLRIAHFMGQMARETGRLRSFIENGSFVYFKRYDPGTPQGIKLGNTQIGDGARFKGRGTVHLTGRENYRKYSEFRFGKGSSYFTVEPNNIIPVENSYYACDTGGYFWVSKQKNVMSNGGLIASGKLSINFWADQGSTKKAAEEVTRRINPGIDGFDEVRWPSFQHAWFVLNDDVLSTSDYRPIEIR